MEGSNIHLTQTANKGVERHTPRRSCSTPASGSRRPSVIVRNHSLPSPSTPISLDWDPSCLQDPFPSGAQYLTVPGIQKRRQSSTNPDIVDNNQILLVDTDESSLDSTLEKIFQEAVQLPSSIISVAMEEDASAILAEVDGVMGNMEMNPVSALREGILDQFLVKLDSLTEDAESCMKQSKTFARKYKADSNGDRKKEVEDAIKQMKETFMTYRDEFAEKKESFEVLPPPPPPAVSAPSGGAPNDILRHLQSEQKNSTDLQLNTQKALIQGAMKQLETEIAVTNWVIAEDDEIKGAMRQVEGWKARKLEIGKSFLSYTAMVETWCPDQLSTPGSVFRWLKSGSPLVVIL